MRRVFSGIRQKLLAGIISFVLISFLGPYLLYAGAAVSPGLLLLFCAIPVVAGAGLYFFFVREALKPIVQAGESLQNFTQGNFEPRYLDLSDREIRDLNERLRKVSVYLSHEMELRQEQMMHTEKLASLGTFLSGIAHELVNPLSNIYTSSQILMEEIDEADRQYQKELITQIEKESGRARNIARSLLEFAREGRAKKELLPLGKLMEETVRFIGAEKPARVGLVFDIEDDITVFVEKQRILQAFLNLLKNALESIASEGTVRISARKGPDDGSVTIEVSDTGSGIDEALLPRVFDAFFTTKGVGKGSGLGLFITHEIIKENNGSIQVQSREGRGTTFTIILPGRES